MAKEKKRHSRESKNPHSFPPQTPRKKQGGEADRSSRERAASDKETKGKAPVAFFRSDVGHGVETPRTHSEYLGNSDSNGEEIRDDQLTRIGEGEEHASAPRRSTTAPGVPAIFCYVPYLAPSTASPQTTHTQQDNAKLGHIRKKGLKFDRQIPKFAVQEELTCIKHHMISEKTKRHQKDSRSRVSGRYEELDNCRSDESDFSPILSSSWHCDRCGNLRSKKFHRRRPAEDEDRPRANWCLRCRIHAERKLQVLKYKGHPSHACWSCGVIRSGLYQQENPIRPGVMPRENLCGKCRGRSLAKLGGLPWSSEIGGESSCLTERIRRLKSLALDDLSVDESDVGDPSPSPAGQATISIRSSPQRDLSSTGSIKKGRAVYWESAETERSEATPKSESASSSRYQRPSCESEHPSEASVPEGPSASCPDTDAVRQPTELNNSRRILSPINVSKTPMMGAKEEAHDNAAFPARHVPAEDQKVKSINEAQLASPRSGDNCKSDMQQLGGLAASAIGNLRYHDTIDELLSGTAASLEADLIATGSRMHGHPNPRHTYRDPAAVSTGSPPERHEISKIANPSAAASITAHPQVDAGTPYIEQLGHSSPLNFNDLCPDPSYYDDNSSLPRYAPARKSVRFQDQDGGESFDLGVACTTDSEYWTRDYNAFLPSSSIRSFTTPTHPDIKVPDFQHGRHSDQRYPYSTADYHQARRDALHSQCCDQSCYPESAFWNVGRGYDYVNGNAQDCTTSPSSLDHMNPRATTPPGASSPFDFDKWSEISHPEDDEFYSHVPDEAEHKWINDCAKIYMAYSMDDTSPTSPGVHHNVPPASRTLYDDLEEFDEKLRAVRSCFRPCDDDDVVSQHDNDAPAGHGYNSPRLGLKRASSSEGDTSLSRAGPKLFPVSASLVVYTGHDSTDDEDDELI